MRMRFWGVRGSTPTTITPEDMTRRISATIERIKPGDLKTAASKNLFLKNLPSYISTTVGGNTSCIEIRLSDNTMLIFDCGTGLRYLEQYLNKSRENITDYHIFLTHFHYDHLMGLPFFRALYNPKNRVTFYSPFTDMEKNIDQFFSAPFHPVGFDTFLASVYFKVLTDDKIKINSGTVHWKTRSHPNGVYAYKITEKGKSCIISTDTELKHEDFDKNRNNMDFFHKVDAIVLDSQYTLGEAINKYSWGHSAYSMAVDFSTAFLIKKLYLFHHEPLYSDKELESILRAAQWYHYRSRKNPNHKVSIDLAREGQYIEL